MRATLIVVMASITFCQADVLLTDPFNGNSVDATRWTVNTSIAGSSVTVAGGYLELRNRGIVTTVADITGPIQIEGSFQLLNNERSNVHIDFRSSGFGGPCVGVQFQCRTDWEGYVNQIALFDYNGSSSQFVNLTTPINLNNWYTFKIVDDTSMVSVFFNNSIAPILSLSTSSTGGQKIVIYNREGSAAGSSISEGGVARIDSIIVSSIPEPSALSLLAVGLGGLAMMRRRRA